MSEEGKAKAARQLLRCVDSGALAPEERSWLDAYHARVRETLGPQLDDPVDQRWLERATQRS